MHANELFVQAAALSAWPLPNRLPLPILSYLISYKRQEPSLDTVTILLLSALNLKSYTPLLWPFNTIALALLTREPLAPTATHTLTSGVKPEHAKKVPQGETAA
eukprot:TRINITY_DN8567_c0_g1_i4.p3 TRINITY_DN8567_c0_g1~~TRINITY_DN8567_c0_g1_i4.p3  ORF type:complete len:104 (-),score=5.83 TRINITY_DN8567_c0_g1_i4:60-371(-)